MAVIVLQDRVRFVETDLMGVVHHSRYFGWFEMGRVEYLRQAGIDLNELMAAGIVFPIVEVTCQYKSPARFDDRIVIETTMTELTRIKMVFCCNIKKETGELLAVGRTKNVFTNDHGQIIKLPAVYFERLQKFFGQDT